MENHDLIYHVKGLIKECKKNDCNEIVKLIEALNELLKYRGVEQEEYKKLQNPPPKSKWDDIFDLRVIKNIDNLKNVIYARLVIAIFLICSAALFINLIQDVTTHIQTETVDCISIQPNSNLEDNKTIKSVKEEYSLDNIYLLITIYFIIFIFLAVCIFLIYKYEYNAWMKDKELSNDLKKSYYQYCINKMMKQ